MSVSAVEAAIQKIREVVKEWDAVGLNYWREGYTKYGVIDPIIRELGWDTSDPKECHPEYPRSYPNGRRADYAMFGIPDVQAIGNNAVPPDIIIESKPLRAELDGAVPQLRRYAQASPRMQSGVAVLTNGNQWWIYDLSLRGSFTSKRVSAGGYHHRRPSGRCPDPAPVAGTFQVRLIRLLSPRVVSGVRTAQVLPVCSRRQVPPV